MNDIAEFWHMALGSGRLKCPCCSKAERRSHPRGSLQRDMLTK